MGKISPLSAKYVIRASILIEGIVDKPDVIGAVFGQTEGLLGADLELRELQRSGRIGRIEVDVETKGGKTRGEITIPSSLDKSETAVVGAALEIIQRIGPCNAKLHVSKIEDVRVSKREFVIKRAKELLKDLMDKSMPDSAELTDEVTASVRVLEIQEYGKDRLPAGPAVADSDNVIIVEGRADVLNLLKYGFKNAIAINGTSVPPSIKDLVAGKETTVFVDGDRGGDLIIKELLSLADIDFVAKAPDGKEVEELTKKEIHKALRSKIASEQVSLEMPAASLANSNNKRLSQRPQFRQQKPSRQSSRAPRVSSEQKKVFSKLMNDLVGTRGAYLLDDKQKVLGKVPSKELLPTLKSLNTGVEVVLVDGVVDKNLVDQAERSRVKYVVGMSVKARATRTNLLTLAEL